MPANSDRELGALTEAVHGIRREMQRDREQNDVQHTENSDKLDQLLGLKPVVEASSHWIATDGKWAVQTLRDGMSQAKGISRLSKMLYVLCGAVGGGALLKLATAVFAAMPK